MLGILMGALLSASSTPAQHQQAASALYQVTTSFNAYGLLVGAADEEGKKPMSEHADGTLNMGSAFAISRDGWLMTARHVVDPAGGLTDLCARLSREWPGAVMLRQATLTVLIEDIAGTTYGFTAEYIPSTWGDNLCMPGVAFAVSYNDTMPARIRALDTVSDLALLSIDASPIRYLELSRTRPDRWSELFAVGYTDPGKRRVQEGAVAIRCELTEGMCVDQADGTRRCPMVLVMRTTAAVLEGMSGSPQVSGDQVVGITTMKSLSSPIGFTVPATYAAAWYRHVRWPQKYRRPTVVCEPTSEQ